MYSLTPRELGNTGLRGRLKSLRPSNLKAAATDTAKPTQIWWRIELPVIRGVVAAAVFYTALISIGEFGTASFLAYGDQGTLPVVLFALIARPGGQNYGMAMAASAILISTIFLLVYIVSRGGSAQFSSRFNT